MIKGPRSPAGSGVRRSGPGRWEVGRWCRGGAVRFCAAGMGGSGRRMPRVTSSVEWRVWRRRWRAGWCRAPGGRGRGGARAQRRSARAGWARRRGSRSSHGRACPGRRSGQGCCPRRHQDVRAKGRALECCWRGHHGGRAAAAMVTGSENEKQSAGGRIAPPRGGPRGGWTLPSGGPPRPGAGSANDGVSCDGARPWRDDGAVRLWSRAGAGA